MKQSNILEFHTDKRARIWDNNVASRLEYLVFYPSFYIDNGSIHVSLIPSFSLIVDSATTVFAFICDENDNAILDISSPVIVDKITYKQIYYESETQSYLPDGYYYITLSIDGVFYYSDMFGFTSDVSDLLKIEVTSSDMYVGGSTQKISTFTNTFYLSASSDGINPKTEEVGDTVDGIVLTNAGTSIFPHEFRINANENIYRYIYSLRMLSCNGVIKITWGYKIFTASDISTDLIDKNGNGTYQIKLTFVDENETVQTLNSIS